MACLDRCCHSGAPRGPIGYHRATVEPIENHVYGLPPGLEAPWEDSSCGDDVTHQEQVALLVNYLQKMPWLVPELLKSAGVAYRATPPGLTPSTHSESPHSEETEESSSEPVNLPVSVWRRMCLPEKGTTGPSAARRWGRLFGKLLCRAMDAVPREDGQRTSVGSVAHAVGRPCRPCPFLSKGKGCFDRELCKFCHFTCGHVLNGEDARKTRARKHRRVRRRAAAAEEQVQ
mmetsp:Transcript_43476/g.94700  ORF Transcript_43476/g.94700 Transcript_43476/m.94700 type:complete len:231 (+) Transcript_43476:47-739(+)